MGVNPLGRNSGFDEAIRTHSEVSLCVPKCESSEALSHCLLRNAFGQARYLPNSSTTEFNWY
jgi:hypothetical protein